VISRIIILFCLPLQTFCQGTDTIPGRNPLNIWDERGIDSTAHFIKLPSLNLGELNLLGEIGIYSSYKYVIGNENDYYRLFKRYKRDSLLKIDFNRTELIARIQCSYCAALGTLDGEPRHRNACSYGVTWFIRDKKIESRNKIIEQ